jgi:hypothetical protein
MVIDPRALRMLGKCSSTELHAQPYNAFPRKPKQLLNNSLVLKRRGIRENVSFIISQALLDRSLRNMYNVNTIIHGI